MRVGRTVLTAAVAVAVTLSGGSAGWANPDAARPDTQARVRTPLPDGWQLTKTTSGLILTWRADQPVRVGNAAVEFYAGDRLLGRPGATPDQRTFHLVIDEVTARNLTDLQVRTGWTPDRRPADRYTVGR